MFPLLVLPLLPVLPLLGGDPAQEDAAARAAASHERMRRVLAEVRRRTPETNPYLGGAGLARARAELARLPEGRSAERLRLEWRIGRDELRMGNVRTGVEALEAAWKLRDAVERPLSAERLQDLRFDLALGWLRLGEVENCVARHSAKSCLYPIGPEGVHPEKEGSRRAMELLLELLAERPDHHAARWLLDVAARTAGAYPEGVPEELRIELPVAEEARAFPAFRDVAAEVGVDDFTLSGGVVADDLDGDGRLDLLVSAWDPGAPLRFHHGLPGGDFEDRTASTGLEGIDGGLNLLQADHDDDGDLDVLVLRGAWLGFGGRIPNSLLENDGRGRFVDVTFAAGLGERPAPTQTAGFADFDLDGDLDLFVGVEEIGGMGLESELFRNEGDGTYTDVTRAAGVANRRFAKGVAWGDHDLDGDPDLFVSNLGQPNRLYRNGGDGTFVDVADEAGVARPHASFAAWFWDFDQDGVLDLFVTSYLPTLGPLAEEYAGGHPDVERAALYRGQGDGTFRDVAAERGLTGVTVTMGSNFGDVDLDGFPDFYLGTGYPDYEALMPNRMFWNRGGRFVDVTVPAGLGHLQKGHGVAFLDHDEDGDMDLFAEMGGAYPGDAFGNALFDDPGFGNHWLAVELQGIEANRCAIGARLACVVEESGAERTVHARVSSGGSFGASPLRQTLGLGRAERIVRLEITWPGSGTRQVVEGLELDRRIRIVEGRAEVELVEPASSDG